MAIKKTTQNRKQVTPIIFESILDFQARNNASKNRRDDVINKQYVKDNKTDPEGVNIKQ